MIPPIFDRIMIFYLLPLERASFLPQIGGFLLYTTPAQCDASSDRTYARTDCTDSHTRDEPRSFVTCHLTPHTARTAHPLRSSSHTSRPYPGRARSPFRAGRERRCRHLRTRADRPARCHLHSADASPDARRSDSESWRRPAELSPRALPDESTARLPIVGCCSVRVSLDQTFESRRLEESKLHRDLDFQSAVPNQPNSPIIDTFDVLHDLEHTRDLCGPMIHGTS